MSDFEERLRSWGAKEAAAAGPAPAFRGAPQRRWLPLTAAAAVLLLVGGVAAAVVGARRDQAIQPSRPPSTAPGPSPTKTASTSLPVADVPWAALAPGPVITQSPLPRATADPTTRHCTGDNLRAEGAGTGDGAGGTILRTWLLTNTSSTPCLLTGQLQTLSGILQGSRRDIPLHSLGAAAGDVQPVVLLPGQSGIAPFNYYPRCDNGSQPSPTTTTFTHLQLQYGGHTLDVHGADSSVDLGCHVSSGINAGPVGRALAPLRFAAQPMSQLHLSIAAPATAGAGQTLQYVLTLSNPTGTDIALQPCPSFVEAAANAEGHYRLNCARARAVPAHGTETFAMELMIPGDADTGSTKLVWSLVAAFEGQAPSTAVTSISITGGSDPAAGHVACDPSSQDPPCTSMRPDTSYPYLLSTHCGLRSLYADGRYWIPTPQTAGSGRPPSGYDDPQDAGTVTLLKPNRLAYRSRQYVTTTWIAGNPPATQCR